jgi:metallophosphoesterase (TIGR00282 family)
MNILFIGDIVGVYGRAVVKQLLPGLKKEHAIELTIANGENSAHGYSITEKIYHELLEIGIDAITMGNHLFEKKELVQKIDTYDRLVRPANFPPGAPGRDHLILDVKGKKVAVVNLLGRVFMQCLDCPFQAADKLIARLREKYSAIIVDFHAEATSEKVGMGYFLDGRAAAVLGTHTHVMTADEKIMLNGTAFITDVGMCGSADSIIGMNKEQIIKRFVTQLPEKFEPTDYGRGLFNAVVLAIDTESGKARSIKRLFITTDPLELPKEAK